MGGDYLKLGEIKNIWLTSNEVGMLNRRNTIKDNIGCLGLDASSHLGASS